ncbi:dimethyladenosine transferase 2, mitochondrial [Diachasma alloeum]|uniref:dimethyladenosine transferase 2, mitochondrial n=1 Tax=Diachasma alloeum TaxID=454923 RepID=UPI0007384766|nr:dimethyladenosine transferase 2, mitochondrial [Diachasma alloeum]
MLRRCFPPKIPSRPPRPLIGPQPSRPSSENAAEKPKAPGRPAGMPSEFTGYDGSAISVEELPFDVMRRTKNFTTLHLLDRDVSKAFASLIIDKIPKEQTFIAEMNPGIGLMTQQLLDSGVSVVHGYDKFTEFMQWLHPLSKRYPGRLHLRPFNLATIAKTDFLDGKINSRNMDKMFEGIRPRDWRGPPAIAVIGAVPNVNFFYSFQWSLVNQYLSDYGRAVLFVAVSPSTSLALTDDPNTKHFHKPKNIFLRTFFDFRKLGTLPRNAFYPWVPEKTWRKRFAEYYKGDSEIMDVVKIEARADFFTEDFTRSDAIIFYYFLSIHMKTRNTRIIPVLEKWIPGCGPRLIREDYDIYSTFDELNSEQLLQLFKTFKSWPEYETSPFINFVETIIQSKGTEE